MSLLLFVGFAQIDNGNNTCFGYINIIVTSIETIKDSMTECAAELSAINSLFCPMYLDTIEVIPAPKLVPTLIIRNSKGITKPTAANWSAPSPATQNESIMLYNDITIIENMSGTANFNTASFGFPFNKFTPSVSSLFEKFSDIKYLLP